MKKTAAKVLRRLIGPIAFKKKLSPEFGGCSIYVTAKADMRLLYPGFQRAGADLMTVAKKYVRPGNCVWDIGSNVGIFAYCSAWIAGEKGSVYTVEADPTFAALQNRSSAALAPDYARVNTLCAAVSDASGILELTIPVNSGARNHLSVLSGNGSDDIGGSRKSVVSVTCDFLLSHWTAPDFVKIDVEGAELLALSGAQKLLSDARPTFYIECGDQNRDALTALFLENTYDLFRLDSQGNECPIARCDFDTIARPRSSRR